MPSVDITTKFNENGEMDLLFYKGNIALHFIDRAIRYSDGCAISSKTGKDIIDGYNTTWYKQRGPFTHLYSDGELGVNNTETLEAFKRLSTEVRIRAPGQHARLAEARNAMQCT